MTQAMISLKNVNKWLACCSAQQLSALIGGTAPPLSLAAFSYRSVR
ncbi:hypothetical protein [Alcaligenes endophyticus]|uniref:Uncharacterized protein n=1 Tax=Alcaligenes endophyticus TaxID=1929088 RepID=A0ABT8EM59_9BURK|nr:hypothetical protein [Alcaligenes endophyticus]MCX5591031.1 hypothetical protein [Alcaligenes endophyticus]MDN4122392.1 hypothetical protein [Alcaligenes endophyticus]